MNKDQTTRSLALEASLKEYEALRAEIDWLGRDGGQYQNFAFILLGIIGTALFDVFTKEGAHGTSIPWIIVPTLLTASLFFCTLAVLYIRQHHEIHIVAGYIADHIRPKIRALCADHDLWRWEEYKSRHGPAGRVTWTVRMCTFLIPALATLLTAASFLQTDIHMPGAIAAWWTWASIDLGAIAYCLFSLLASGGPKLVRQGGAKA